MLRIPCQQLLPHGTHPLRHRVRQGNHALLEQHRHRRHTKLGVVLVVPRQMVGQHDTPASQVVADLRVLGEERLEGVLLNPPLVDPVLLRPRPDQGPNLVRLHRGLIVDVHHPPHPGGLVEPDQHRSRIPRHRRVQACNQPQTLHATLASHRRVGDQPRRPTTGT